MITLDRIAKTINGPNETTHITREKLHQLQDVRWGQLKSQDQAKLLRCARFIQQLYEEDAILARQPPPIPGTSLPPPIPKGSPTPPPAIPAMPVCRASTDDILRIFRAFVLRNATQWTLGSNHHHPMWAMVAEEITDEDPSFGPDYAFIQPENKKKHVILVEEYADMIDEREATDRG